MCKECAIFKTWGIIKTLGLDMEPKKIEVHSFSSRFPWEYNRNSDIEEKLNIKSQYHM